jgi:hypothetical protein
MKDYLENKRVNPECKSILDRSCCLPAQRLVDLNLGSGSAGPFIVTTPATVFTLTTAVNVVSVSVGADDFTAGLLPKEGCGCRKSRVLLNFFADVYLSDVAVATTLNFQLVRSNDNVTVPIGPVSTLNLTSAPGFPLVAAHAFNFLDDNIEPGDYTYSVQISPPSSVSAGPGVVGSYATVTLATLSAIAAAV